MRLFIAVLFNEQIKDNLCDCIEKLKQNSQRGNFSRRENLHLTLVFIGETNKVSAVKQAMDKVDENKFDLAIQGFGKFKRGGSDICWIGVQKCQPLDNIYNKLCSELRNSGFVIENRAYTPHLTLGREVVLSSNFDENAYKNEIRPMNFPVTKISLMKSERIGGKLTYTEIYSKELFTSNDLK